MGHKVLLADDSITVQKIVKLSLSEEGMEVIAFGNGEQAVEQIESIKPDLVMADVFMPGKDGYEVCEFVKAHPQLKDTPVILLVHAFEPFDPERAKKAGADHQLTKPFQSIRTLVQTVQDLLSKPAEASASATPVTETTPAPAMSAMPAPQPVSPLAPPAMAQPAEEFAVVSSLTPPPMSEPENLFVAQPQPTPMVAEMPIISVSAAPSAMPVAPPVPLTESELPGPPPISGGLVGAADMMPPLDLPVIPQVSFEPVAEVPSQVLQAPTSMPVMAAPAFPVMAAPAPQSPATPVMSAPVSQMAPPAPMPAPMMMTPMDMGDDDLLELPDMMPAPMSPAPGVQPLASPQSFANAAPDMAVLSTLGATMPPAMPAEAQPAFPQSVDMGIGTIDLNAAMSAAPVNFEEDVKVGTVAPQTSTESAQLSEAMIEEIVKRVVERLSTKAIQEVAWEVVPEMAELMIRKQIAQHQQLSH